MTTMPAVLPRYTPEEYLALERAAEYKSEYIDGHIYAMSGGTKRHSLIKVALVRLIDTHLLDSHCATLDSDMRVRVDPSLYTNPDLTVVCGEPEVEDVEDDTLLNPTAIFEVLSPSTEAYDRGEKWARYRRMPSLKQYVLVSQDKPRIEVYTRQGDVWTFSDAGGLDASIHLESIGCTLALAEVYRRVGGGAGGEP